MAIQEHDREDLLRDGKSMPLRGEARIDHETIIVGFRSGGQTSLYCGTDPVFQFNAEQQLRRVFMDGQRYAAENGKLVRLDRESRGGRVTFAKQMVSAERESEIQRTLSKWVLRIQEVNESPTADWHVVCSQDANGDIADRITADFVTQLRRWFNTIRYPLKIACRPDA